MRHPLFTLCGPQLYTKWTIKGAKCITFFGIFLALLLGPRVFESEEQQNCFGLLVFASLMWAFEVRSLAVCSTLPFDFWLATPHCSASC